MDVAGTIALKVITKVALNAVFPGSGTAVDVCEAVKDVADGNYVGAAINLGSAVADLVTLGLFGAAKDVAKESGKQAAIGIAKDSAKASTKKIGQEAAKQIAKGGSKNVLAGAAIITAKKVEKEIGMKLGKELAKGMLEDVTEEAFKRSLLETTIQGAKMNLIGSGGKHVAEEILQGGAHNVLSWLSSLSSREVLKSATAKAAKEAADKVAKKFIEDTMEKELMWNLGKGIAKQSCYIFKR